MIDAIAHFYKTCSEPARLRILNILLSYDAVCVCDVVTTLDLSQPLVSRHLSYLKNAGLAEVFKQGNWRYYGLSKQLTPLQVAALNVLKQQLDMDPQCIADRNQFNPSVCGE